MIEAPVYLNWNESVVWHIISSIITTIVKGCQKIQDREKSWNVKEDDKEDKMEYKSDGSSSKKYSKILGLNTTFLVTAINVSQTNISIKRQRLSDFKIQSYAVYIDTP